MIDLEALWKSRLDSLIGTIAAGETDHIEIASLASHIGADYHGRFLIELLQNAEDQAIKSSLIGTTVLVVRTDTTVAVFNRGMPFDINGVRSITSAGISYKDPSETIGNKGIGFKAVFQISSQPEIYSGSSIVKGLYGPLGTAFQMEQRPFDLPQFRHHLQKLAENLLKGDTIRLEKLKKVAGHLGPVSFVLEEARQVAPFKFPQRLEKSDLDKRIQELQISPNMVRGMTTLIFLPLIDDDPIHDVVDNAFDELLSAKQPGATLVFLKGIGRVKVLDRKRGQSAMIGRWENGPQMQIEKGTRNDDITTFSINLTDGKTKRSKLDWWRFKRTIGKEGDDLSTREVERKEIKKAASKLPGAHWDKVESVRLSVAFPKPHNGMNPWKPFGADGLISIGLPTKAKTGTPVWLNGPFHGYIARTEIDLVSQPYNELIFRHLVDLFWNALNYLKQSDNLKTKRSVVLYFEHTEGHLARTIEKKVKWSELNVVLSSEGHHYYRPKDLSIPSIEDMKIFKEIFSKINDLEYYGFRLPDNLIMKNARSLLEHLAEDNDIAVSNDLYLEKKHGGYSLIEQAAASNRLTGREFWESFLSWIAETFDYESLYDLLFLPVDDNEIEKPNKKVFFRPLMRKTERDEFVKQLKEDDEEIIEDIDDTVFSGLGFFDERCVAVRRDEGKNPYALTDLARKLSPDTGIQLVRRPRKPELINDVLGPRLCEICVNEKDKKPALSILKQIGDWMASMGKKNKDLVSLDDLVVPVAGHSGSWKWMPPTKVYMGNAWVNDRVGRLLEEAYGQRENARLVPWQEFSDNLDDSEKDKSNWLNRMEALGVAKSPRIMIAEPGGPAPLKSWSYDRLSIEEGIPCPLEGGEEYWESYLDRVRHRKCDTKTGQAFYIRDVIWIDGLEIPESRASVLELILRNSTKYMNYLAADVQRRSGWDRKSGYPSLWIFAIQHNKWEIIPSNIGPLSPDKVWLLGMEDQRRIFVRERLMPFIPDAFKDAWTILRAIGVFAPEEALPSRIIEALQNVAANINFLKTENYRALRAYVRALYEWLDASFSRNDEGQTTYENLLFRPVPLLQRGELESIDLQNLPVVYIEDDSQRSRFIPSITFH